MAYIIGQVINLTAAFAVDSASVAVTILAPDGTRDGPHAAAHDGPGLYSYNYEAAHAGRYWYRFEALTPDNAAEGMFDVNPSRFVT